MTNGDYYVRWRGQVTGPLGLEQLKAMVAQGRLSKLHGVSADQAQWDQARTFEELFPPYQLSGKTIRETIPDTVLGVVGESIAEPEPAQVEQAAAEWYYAHDQHVEGPCSASVVQRLVADGTLTLDDYVNASSDPWVWQRIGDVAEFATVAGAKAAEPSYWELDTAPETGVAAGATQETYSGLAVTSLVLGVVGVIVPVCGLIALILASKAKRGMAATGDHSGEGTATAGVVLGIIDIGFDVIKLGVLLAVLL